MYHQRVMQRFAEYPLHPDVKQQLQQQKLKLAKSSVPIHSNERSIFTSTTQETFTAPLTKQNRSKESVIKDEQEIREYMKKNHQLKYGKHYELGYDSGSNFFVTMNQSEFIPHKTPPFKREGKNPSYGWFVNPNQMASWNLENSTYRKEFNSPKTSTYKIVSVPDNRITAFTAESQDAKFFYGVIPRKATQVSVDEKTRLDKQKIGQEMRKSHIYGENDRKDKTQTLQTTVESTYISHPIIVDNSMRRELGKAGRQHSTKLGTDSDTSNLMQSSYKVDIETTAKTSMNFIKTEEFFTSKRALRETKRELKFRTNVVLGTEPSDKQTSYSAAFLPVVYK